MRVATHQPRVAARVRAVWTSTRPCTTAQRSAAALSTAEADVTPALCAQRAARPTRRARRTPERSRDGRRCAPAVVRMIRGQRSNAAAAVERCRTSTLTCPPARPTNTVNSKHDAYSWRKRGRGLASPKGFLGRIPRARATALTPAFIMLSTAAVSCARGRNER